MIALSHTLTSCSQSEARNHDRALLLLVPAGYCSVFSPGYSCLPGVAAACWWRLPRGARYVGHWSATPDLRAKVNLTPGQVHFEEACHSIFVHVMHSIF